MPEVLRFSTNIPEIIALQHAQGKLKPSTLPNTPPDVQFILEDGRAMYLPTRAAEEIYRNRIQPHMPFEICRRQGNRFEITPKNVEASAHSWQGNAPAPVPSAAPATNERAQSNTPAGQLSPVSMKFMAAYKDAIDTLIEAKTYAQQQGLALEIRCEDVRCLAATIMIDIQKGGAR